MIVNDINDNAPTFLKDYRPVVPEYASPMKVIEISATDDDDRSKSNGPPFTFRMDPNADDIIRASFKVESDNSKRSGKIRPLLVLNFIAFQRAQMAMAWR